MHCCVVVAAPEGAVDTVGAVAVVAVAPAEANAVAVGAELVAILKSNLLRIFKMGGWAG